MIHLWSVLCSRVITDQVTGKVSLIDVPEILHLPQELADTAESNPFRMVMDLKLVTFFWMVDGDELKFEVRVSVRNPNGKKQLESVVVVDDEKPIGYEGVRILHDIPKIFFAGFGLYQFDVHTRKLSGPGNWKKVASLPLLVKLLGAT
ncbi:MAG TPA: hypothetical protein VN851_09030 [Thermoanaerobaculia bacterium]|nr:hypothetical protein [Thermoanaerobaculia bacterium]